VAWSVVQQLLDETMRAASRSPDPAWRTTIKVLAKTDEMNRQALSTDMRDGKLASPRTFEFTTGRRQAAKAKFVEYD
jgi:hypothetical protein